MNKTQKIWLWTITIALIAVVGVVVFGAKKQVIVQEEDDVGGSWNLMSHTFDLGGARLEAHGQSLTQGTTTPCWYVITATSTPVSLVADVKMASTSATVWGWYKSAGNPTATTTLISNETSFSAGAGGTLMGSTTASMAQEGDIEGNYIFAPGNVVVLGAQGGDMGAEANPKGFIPNGACSILMQAVVY